MRKFPPPRKIRPMYGAALGDDVLDFEEYCQAYSLPDYFYELELQLRAKLMEDGGLRLTWLNSGESNKLFHGEGVQLLDNRGRVMCSFAELDERDSLDMVLQYTVRLAAKRGQHWLSPRQRTRAPSEGGQARRRGGVSRGHHHSRKRT